MDVGALLLHVEDLDGARARPRLPREGLRFVFARKWP